MTNEVEIYDTTLRDGSQQAGISLTVADKLRVARLLDDLGVGYVEGGWPGANPKDNEFFERAKTELSFSNSILTAFGSTRRPNGNVKEDGQLGALLDAETEVICIVGKAWDYHVREALRIDLDEGIRMVAESVEHLVANDRTVFYDAEHFFDGYAANSDYALTVLKAAFEAGAKRLVLCDTNGGKLPGEVAATVKAVQEFLPDAQIGVHFHNDVGCAVASTLTSVELGVRQIQGCINGYGERTGNADFSTILPDLVLKMGIPVLTQDQLASLSPIAHHIAEVVNIALDPHRPYVGTSAFTHKAGLHTSALARRRDAYEHQDPTDVGNQTRMVVSELAGRASVQSKATELGLDLSDAKAKIIIGQIKDLEHQGYLFEVADGTFELLVRTAGGWTQKFFELESYRVHTERRRNEEVVAEATVKVLVDGKRVVTIGEGVGPVHALDQALRAALRSEYPRVADLRLIDYRVRVLDSRESTGGTVRVLVETADRTGSWGTVGVHQNVIEASWQALADGIVVGLLRLEE